MKKADRQPWLDLRLTMAEFVEDEDTGEEVPSVVNAWWASLCNMCRYAKWNDYDESGECGHPILGPRDDAGEHFNEVWARQSDCWAFRPKLTLARAQEIAASGVPWDGTAG